MRFFLLFLASILAISAQNLSISSGNGQIVLEQFLTTVPLVVEATDATGKPVSGLAVTWTITQGQGTLEGPATTTTGANGQASITFLATGVPPGNSYSSITITATAGASSVNFFLTTVLSRQSGGGLAAPPQGQLTKPQPGGTLSGPAGTTLPGAVQVVVAALSGGQAGQPVPNVGVRLQPSGTSGISAACNAPGGIVLTNAQGLASCDVVLGPQTGTAQFNAVIGEAQTSPAFNITVTPGAACTYSVSPLTAAIPATGGVGSVNVSAGVGCTWTAVSNVGWIVPTPASGAGTGSVSYTVAANAGVVRSGILTIAGQSVTITQGGTSAPQPLSITTSSALPAATVNVAYGVNLQASGGSGSYQWTLLGTLPPGLAFANSGRISGVPSTQGSYSFNVSLTDTVTGASLSQAFTLPVGASGGALTITNASFPNGVVGQTYNQVLTTSGGCVTPFSGPSLHLLNGPLPPGVSLVQNPDASFSIAGTPTTPGSYPFALSVTDACGNSASGNFTITIAGGSGQTSALTASPAGLSFTVAPGNSTAAAQTVMVQATSAVAFTAAASTATGGNWLVVAPNSASTPASLSVSIANAGQLAPGNYNGSITLTPAAGNAVVLPVSLTVAAQQNTLVITPSTLNVTLPNTGNTVQQQTLTFASSGNPASFTLNYFNTQGSWLSVAPTSGTTPAIITATFNAANLPPGTYTGGIFVTVGSGLVYSEMYPISLTVLPGSAITASSTSLTFSSTPTSSPGPQTFSLTGNPSAISFTTAVSTTSGGNWLTVSPPSGTTPAALQVAVNSFGLSAGTYTGLVAIQGSASLVNIPITFNVAPAAPTITAVTNAASFIPGAVSAGEIITIFGSQIGLGTGAGLILGSNGLIGTTLGGTQVLFDGIPAPVIYSSAGQVSAIVPFELAGRASTMLQVQASGSLSPTLNLQVADTSPAIFTLDSSGQGAILNQDGSVNSATNGAASGSIVSIYATGAGETNPAGVDGQIVGSSPLPTPIAPVTVQIAGMNATIYYAGAAPGLPAGMLQVNALVPTALNGQRVPVTLTAGTQTSVPVYLNVSP